MEKKLIQKIIENLILEKTEEIVADKLTTYKMLITCEEEELSLLQRSTCGLFFKIGLNFGCKSSSMLIEGGTAPTLAKARARESQPSKLELLPLRLSEENFSRLSSSRERGVEGFAVSSSSSTEFAFFLHFFLSEGDVSPGDCFFIGVPKTVAGPVLSAIRSSGFDFRSESFNTSA